MTFIKQYEQQKGKIDGKKFMGNVVLADPMVLKEIGPRLTAAWPAGPTAGDSTDPKATEYVDARRGLPGQGGHRPVVGRSRTTTTTRRGPDRQALEAVNGDLSDGQPRSARR